MDIFTLHYIFRTYMNLNSRLIMLPALEKELKQVLDFKNCIMFNKY